MKCLWLRSCDRMKFTSLITAVMISLNTITLGAQGFLVNNVVIPDYFLGYKSRNSTHTFFNLFFSMLSQFCHCFYLVLIKAGAPLVVTPLSLPHAPFYQFFFYAKSAFTPRTKIKSCDVLEISLLSSRVRENNNFQLFTNVICHINNSPSNYLAGQNDIFELQLFSRAKFHSTCYHHTLFDKFVI